MSEQIRQAIDIDFNGAILVKKDDIKVFEEAFGLRDIPNEIPNMINTKFATASAGKVFVAIGILQLIEQGKLTLDSTIGKLLNIDLKKINPKITVKQLLSHTSGIPDYFDESVMENYADLWTDFPNYKIRKSNDLLPLFINKEMTSTGGKFQYNNTGFVVLGMIIESITGLAFDEYLENAVFKPANMKDTGYYELDRLPKNCANNYIWDEEREVFYTNIFSVDAKGTGAGGAFTTVGDIEKLWDNLLNGKLLSEKMVSQMMSLQASDDEDKYGYGIWLSDSLNPWFQGSDPGVSFFTFYDKEEKLMIIAVSNTGDNVWEIGEKIMDITG